MTDAQAIDAIRAWEPRRQNAAAEYVKHRWRDREIERADAGLPQLACGCLVWSPGDYVAAYEYAKDR